MRIAVRAPGRAIVGLMVLFAVASCRSPAVVPGGCLGTRSVLVRLPRHGQEVRPPVAWIVAESDSGEPGANERWLVAQVFVVDARKESHSLQVLADRVVRQWHVHAPDRSMWSSDRKSAWEAEARLELPGAGLANEVLLHEDRGLAHSEALEAIGTGSQSIAVRFRPGWYGGDALRRAKIDVVRASNDDMGLLLLGEELPAWSAGTALLPVGPWTGTNVEALRLLNDRIFEHRRLVACRLDPQGRGELVWLVTRLVPPTHWPLKGLAPNVGFLTAPFVRVKDLR